MDLDESARGNRRVAWKCTRNQRIHMEMRCESIDLYENVWGLIDVHGNAGGIHGFACECMGHSWISMKMHG